MNLPSEQQSFWMHPLSKTYPRLQDDIEIDVAIIGGGIAGVTIGIKHIFVEVYAGNENAIKFYQKVSFTPWALELEISPERV